MFLDVHDDLLVVCHVRPPFKPGAGGRTRTGNRLITNRVLCQLSYPGVQRLTTRRRKMIALSVDRAHNRVTMVKRNHISVEIDATFGSSFQEEVAVRLLGKYIGIWRAFFLEKHKKNDIDFRVINAEVSSPVPRQRRRSGPIAPVSGAARSDRASGRPVSSAPEPSGGRG